MIIVLKYKTEIFLVYLKLGIYELKHVYIVYISYQI
jgi:hypothetical protein